MKFLLTLLLFVVSCSTGLKPGADDEGGCDEGYERNLDYNCVPVASSVNDLDNACSAASDCTIELCPEGSVGCTCLEEEGFCVPTCSTDDDCPEAPDVILVCDSSSICSPESD